MKLLCLCVLLLALLAVSDAKRHSERREQDLSHTNPGIESELAEARQDAVSYLETLEQFTAEGNTLAASPLKPLSTSLKECHPRRTRHKKGQRKCHKSIANLFGGGGHHHKGPSVDDAVSGIDEWLAHFKKRVGPGQTLWIAARDAVKPLLSRLKRTQHEAVERLIESNREIREHVEEVATEHIFELLKANQKHEDEAEKIEKSTLKKKEIEEQLKEKELEFKNNAHIIKLEAQRAKNSTKAATGKAALKEAKKEEKKMESEVKKDLGA